MQLCQLKEQQLLFKVVMVRGDSGGAQASDKAQVLGMRVLGAAGLDWVVWDYEKAKKELEYTPVHHPLKEQVKDIASAHWRVNGIGGSFCSQGQR